MPRNHSRWIDTRAMALESEPPPEDRAMLIKSSLGWRGIVLAHIVLIAWIALTTYYAWK
ncbi:hypothetical protein AA103193_2579 [Tanticharoenia sakaeratensis NBRC 103193]|nr:hypothetical protein AA103193_2579 [Tanticharoenia sakaeratensis NBRC 103193]